MPTLKVTRVNCSGFNEPLRFCPKLGNQKGREVTANRPLNQAVTFNGFDSGDRFFIIKVGDGNTYEGEPIPARPGARGVCSCSAHGKTLSAHYEVDD